MLTVTGSIEPLRIANYLSPAPLYSWDFRSSSSSEVFASNDLSISSRSISEEGLPSSDIILITGSWGAEHYENASCLSWLRKQSRQGKTLIAIEMAVHTLAKTGLLADKRATTHWSWKPGLAEAFPNIEVLEQLFTSDRTLHTVAGSMTCIDFMLSMIADHHGEDLAAEVGNQMLYCGRRPAEAPQRTLSNNQNQDTHQQVRAAISLIEQNIEDPLSVPQICERLSISQRQLERIFKRDTGCSIVQFRQLVRLQHARVLLTSTSMSIREVAVACGFNSLSYFSLTFQKCFGKKPSLYRQAWPSSEPAPSWPGTLYDFVREDRGLNS
jgi:transcriptional regulator GlxA family with amidase domain